MLEVPDSTRESGWAVPQERADNNVGLARIPRHEGHQARHQNVINIGVIFIG
jgi:hypothetical protein